MFNYRCPLSRLKWIFRNEKGPFSVLNCILPNSTFIFKNHTRHLRNQIGCQWKQIGDALKGYTLNFPFRSYYRGPNKYDHVVSVVGPMAMFLGEFQIVKSRCLSGRYVAAAFVEIVSAEFKKISLHSNLVGHAMVKIEYLNQQFIDFPEWLIRKVSN